MVLTVDLGAVGTESYQTGAVGAILDRHPNLRLVIAHLAQPPLGSADNTRLLHQWKEQVLLARNPQVWLDMAALPAYSNENYPYPTALELLRKAVELIGSAKILWGSDVPGLLNRATYHQLLDYMVQYSEFLSETDRARILGENAAFVYGK